MFTKSVKIPSNLREGKKSHNSNLMAAPLPVEGLRIPHLHWIDYRCESYALELNKFSELAAGLTFDSQEVVRAWVMNNINRAQHLAQHGETHQVLFWYPTIDDPNRYHWVRRDVS